MNVTPFGAKSPSSTVVGVAANADGNLVTEKKWQNEQVSIFTSAENLDASNYKIGEIVDVSDAAAVSLLIRNANAVGFTIKFYGPGTNYRLYDAYGSEYGIHVSEKSIILITPDDLPILQWLPEIRISVKLDSDIEGTANTFWIKAIIKR